MQWVKTGSVCLSCPPANVRQHGTLLLNRQPILAEEYDIYREGNGRYLAITFNVRGRDLGTTVEEAIKQMAKK